MKRVYLSEWLPEAVVVLILLGFVVLIGFAIKADYNSRKKEAIQEIADNAKAALNPLVVGTNENGAVLKCYHLKHDGNDHWVYSLENSITVNRMERVGKHSEPRVESTQLENK